jgi:hypothetical protein
MVGGDGVQQGGEKQGRIKMRLVVNLPASGFNEGRGDETGSSVEGYRPPGQHTAVSGGCGGWSRLSSPRPEGDSEDLQRLRRTASAELNAHGADQQGDHRGRVTLPAALAPTRCCRRWLRRWRGAPQAIRVFCQPSLMLPDLLLPLDHRFARLFHQ